MIGQRTLGSSARKQTPAGTRPPAPPWMKIVVWLVLLICLALAGARAPLLAWSAAQPNMPLAALMPATSLAPSTASRKPTREPHIRVKGLDRLRGTTAAIIRLVLLPPGFLVVQGVGALGLAVIGLELTAAVVLLVVQRQLYECAGSLVLRVRLPQTQGKSTVTVDTATDLLRALHQQLPPTPPLFTSWLVLTLGAHRDEPAELGIVIGGSIARLRRHIAAVVRKSIEGLAPDAVVDVRPDPLAEACAIGRTVTWSEWRTALSPSYPLRLHTDQAQGTLLGSLAAAVAPRDGMVYEEVQVVLQARRDDVHLARGWRAAATRRLLRLKGRHEYTLPPDVPALEAKLAGPAFHVTLRAVAVAEPSHASAAAAELAEIDAAISQYAARSGSRLQRWVRASTRNVRLREAPHWMKGWRGATSTALLGSGVFALAWLLAEGFAAQAAELVGLWPLLVLPVPLSGWLQPMLTMLVSLLLALAAVTIARRWACVDHGSRLAPARRRTPRAVPHPGVLWPPAWRGPAILSPDELAGLWHLPTPTLGRLVRWLPCRHFPPPPHAFLPPAPPTDGPPARLILGIGRHRDGSEAPVGLPLRDARQGLAFTAPPGVGKTQLASNLADQLRPCGYTLIDGKGDDAGNLVETMRRRIPLEDEARLVVLDVLDSEWPVGFNPLAGVDLSNPGGVDQVLGQIEAVFARLDPETWARAPRMKNYLRKATLLVLAGEPNPTLAHVKQAILDEHYRQTLLPHCRNVEVVDFWTVEYPQIGEQQRVSRDALISRFDMLLDSELTRFLFNQTTPALSFDTVIAEKLIVLAPLPHRTLGGLAAPVGVLLFQALMRAAFRRPGSDLTRPEYGFIGDEFQVLVENCDTKDVRDALTQVRSFGIITIIANQLHAQLGDLAEYALTAIANRVLLRTQEPDATLYARHYAASGVTAADISGQEPREHQYAWLGVDGQLTRLFSMRPLPWQPPLVLEPPPYHGPEWEKVLPPSSTTPAFDRVVQRLMHGEIADEAATATALAHASDEQWEWLIARWDAVRVFQRQYILDHPGCIPDTPERQRWLSRLRAARRRVLAEAEYARVRHAVTPAPAGSTTESERMTTRSPAPQEQAARSPSSDASPTQQPHHTELNNRPPSRITRVEPSDVPNALEREAEDAVEEVE